MYLITTVYFYKPLTQSFFKVWIHESLLIEMFSCFLSMLVSYVVHSILTYGSNRHQHLNSLRKHHPHVY